MGDPTWGDGKGKAIIGAVNYLASKGMNAVSFLTFNIEGDDRNVFLYTDYMWEQSAHALHFFQSQQLPVEQMENADDLLGRVQRVLSGQNG